MWCVLAVASVAYATTTRSSGKLSFDLKEGENPVSKVVKLLTDMKEQLEKEKDTDESDYEKMQCWCEVNNKEKNAAILAYEAKIEELKAEIDSRTKRADKLTGQISAKKEEIAELTNSIAATEEQRAKQNKENQAEIIEFTKNIQALKGAVTVLKKHQLTAFPQTTGAGRKLNFLSMGSKKSFFAPNDNLDKLSNWMQEHRFGSLSDASQQTIEKAVSKFVAKQSPATAQYLAEYSAQDLAFLARAKKLVQGFMQGYVAGYQNQSGEIFGILKQLLEEMGGDLSDTEAKEAQQKEDAKALLSELKTQLAEAEKMLMSKEMALAENNKALADAKENMEDAETSLDADSKFLKQVIDMCGQMDTHFEERIKTRNLELSAIGEALKMLTADDARDLFTSTLGFVQLRSLRRVRSARQRASDVLRKAGAKAKDSTLIALSTSVALDGFEKVKKAINEMIADLKTQQADEVKHKDFCTKEFQKNDMDTIAKTDEKKDLDSKIDVLTEQLATLTDEIAKTKAALEQTKVELMSASMDRVEENKAFQDAVSDQRATQALLEKVQVRLAKFYTEGGALVQAKHGKTALVQGKHKQPAPPVQIVEYKKSGGASPVITMIDNLIHDAALLEKEAITDENTAQQEYEKYVADSNESMDAKIRSITNLVETKATTETELQDTTTSSEQAAADLESLSAYAADLHKACDFTLKNFDIRQEARGAEIEALQEALAILSGMQ
jgi:hypothetical protein